MRNTFLSILLSLSAFMACAEETVLPDIITRVSRAGKTEIIVMDEERLSGFSSAEQALESAGFSFKKSNNELTYHGYWNSSIKVYINNVLMNDPNTGKFDFSTLDFSTVKSIKVDPVSVKGSVSVYITTLSNDYSRAGFYAGAESLSYINSFNDSPSVTAGGTVPVVFDSGSALLIQDNLSVSRKENHFGWRSKSADYKPSFEDSYSGYEDSYSGYERTLFNNSLLVDYSTAAFPGASFGFSSYASYSDANCGETGGKYYTKENQTDLSLAFALPVFLPFENWNLKLLPSYKYSDLDYTNEGRLTTLEDEYKVSSLSFQAESLVFGFVNLYALASYDFSDERSVSADGTQTSSHSLFSAFFSPSVSLSLAGWNLTLALPLDYFGPSDSVELLYSLTAERRFSSLLFFFTASRNITNPVFQQLYYSGSGGSGNPDLKSETAYSFYTGLSYSEAVEVSVKPFLIFYKDKIGWVSDRNGNWSPDNYASSINYGADVYVSTKDILGPVSFCLSYTYCKALLDSGGDTDGNQIMYTPVHTLSLTGKYRFAGNFVWSSVFSYNSRKYTSNANTSYVPDYFNLDTGLSWSAGHWTARILWQNVFDFQYTHIDGYPSPGTSVSFGIKFNL